jgi:hypothetical protein
MPTGDISPVRHPPVRRALSEQLGEVLTYTSRRFYNSAMFAGLARICFLVVALAGLLQNEPGSTQQANSTERQASSRAMARHEMDQGRDQNLAMIAQSRSTNSPGYKLVIHNDGSATADIDAFRAEPPRSQEFSPGTIDTKTLRQLLAELGDVSRIPIGNCAKSVSFGTRTQITYAGKTSGDLQCIQPRAADGDPALRQAWEDLSTFVRTTLSQLKIERVGRTG